MCRAAHSSSPMSIVNRSIGDGRGASGKDRGGRRHGPECEREERREPLALVVCPGVAARLAVLGLLDLRSSVLSVSPPGWMPACRAFVESNSVPNRLFLKACSSGTTATANLGASVPDRADNRRPQPPFGRPGTSKRPRWRSRRARRAGAPPAALQFFTPIGGRSAGKSLRTSFAVLPNSPNRRPPWRSAARTAGQRTPTGWQLCLFSCSLLPCFLAANPPRPGATDRRGTGIRPGGPTGRSPAQGTAGSRGPPGIHPAVAAAAYRDGWRVPPSLRKNLTLHPRPKQNRQQDPHNRSTSPSKAIAPRFGTMRILCFATPARSASVIAISAKNQDAQSN